METYISLGQVLAEAQHLEPEPEQMHLEVHRELRHVHRESVLAKPLVAFAEL